MDKHRNNVTIKCETERKRGIQVCVANRKNKMREAPKTTDIIQRNNNQLMTCPLSIKCWLYCFISLYMATICGCRHFYKHNISNKIWAYYLTKRHTNGGMSLMIADTRRNWGRKEELVPDDVAMTFLLCLSATCFRNMQPTFLTGWNLRKETSLPSCGHKEKQALSGQEWNAISSNKQWWKETK